MLIKSQTKISHKVLYTEISLHSWGFEFWPCLHCDSEHAGVQHSDISSQTGDPSNRQQLSETEGIPRHYVFVWLYHNGEGSSLPALIMVTLACNKHFSFKCVCLSLCIYVDVLFFSGKQAEHVKSECSEEQSSN